MVASTIKNGNDRFRKGNRRRRRLWKNSAWGQEITSFFKLCFLWNVSNCRLSKSSLIFLLVGCDLVEARIARFSSLKLESRNYERSTCKSKLTVSDLLISGRRMESEIVDRFGKLKEQEHDWEIKTSERTSPCLIYWWRHEKLHQSGVLKTGNPTTLQTMVFFNHALLAALKEWF